MSLQMFNKHSLSKNYKWVSLGLFLLCLFFPAFYLGESREPQYAAALLLIGWLGPLDLHFSWYAIPLYFIAIKKNDETSGKNFALLAFIFSISFLLRKDFMINENGSHDDIVAYGWGYYLWVVSIGILLIGNYLSSTSANNSVFLKYGFCWLAVSMAIFSSHYFVGNNSIHSIKVQRKALFSHYCQLSGERINSKVDGVESLFFDIDSSVKNQNQFSDIRSEGQTMVNNGYLRFIEARNRLNSQIKNEDLPYIKYEFKDSKGITINNIQSQYIVITKPFIVPNSLALRGAEIYIKELKNDIVISQTIYIVDNLTHESCGYNPQGNFEFNFIKKSLGLTKKFQSIYD